MGDSLLSTRPDEAGVWYRKSLEMTKGLGPRREAQKELAERNETLAAALVTKAQASERLGLLQEANAIRQEMARTDPTPPLDRVHLMRSYCRLSDAELAMNNIADARKDAEATVPFFNEFKMTSPSLVVLRDIAFCYESLGDVERRVAMDA